MFDLQKFFRKGELIPAVVIDYKTKDVLMLAYMNQESMQKTIDSGFTWFFSRSRGELWNKGATSGHTQEVKRIDYDCDEDSLIVYVKQNGPACHTGENSCFYRTLIENEDIADANPLISLARVVEHRKRYPEPNSYTCYLFEKGLDKILKKVGEESAETIIAAKNGDKQELIGEISDLLYHLTVMMNVLDIPVELVMEELQNRSNKIGNLKNMKTVDRNT